MKKLFVVFTCLVVFKSWAAVWESYEVVSKVDGESADTFAMVSDDSNNYILGKHFFKKGDVSYSETVLVKGEFEQNKFTPLATIGLKQGYASSNPRRIIKTANNEILITGQFKKENSEVNIREIWKVSLNNPDPKLVYADKDGLSSNGLGFAQKENMVVSAGRVTTDKENALQTLISTDYGETFKIIDQFQLVEGKPTSSFAAIFNEKGLFVLGNATDAEGKNLALIRHTKDLGASWETLTFSSDDQNLPLISLFNAKGLKGRILINGQVLSNDSIKSDAAVWELDLSTLKVKKVYQDVIPGATYTYAQDIVANSDKIYVALKTASTTTNPYWNWSVVQLNSDFSDKNVIDLFFGLAFEGAPINYLSILSSGELAAGGYSFDAAKGGRAIVRKLAP